MDLARRLLILLCLGAAACLGGCTSLPEYVHNGFKVGPEYCGAKAEVAPQWLDAADARVRSTPADLSRWWTVFNDPVMNDLVFHAYSQNITVKEAGARVLQARAALGIAKGELFPQGQAATGSYSANEMSFNPLFPPVPKFTDNWNFGFNLAWELDFWGRFRREVKSTNDQFEGSVEDYDAALVTLVGDVASNYVQMRQSQEQIVLAKQNVKLQNDVLGIVTARFQAGRATELDVDQARSTLSQTLASIPAFEIIVRQSQNAICTLLGIPCTDLQSRLGEQPIPAAPAEAVVGIPANLLERRPDVRRAGAMRPRSPNRSASRSPTGIRTFRSWAHSAIRRLEPGLSHLFTPANQFGAWVRRSSGTSSSTDGSPTTSACRTPSFKRPCWPIEPRC